MLAAVEATLDRSAKDETERSRNRRKLYEPPSGAVVPRGTPSRPQGIGASQAAALLALAD